MDANNAHLCAFTLGDNRRPRGPDPFPQTTPEEIATSKAAQKRWQAGGEDVV